MVDKELKDYIEKNFKKSFSIKKFRKELISLGWKYYEINEALEEFNNKPIEIPIKKKFAFFKIFLTIFIFLLIVLVGSYYYFFYSPPIHTQEIYLDNATMFNGAFLSIIGESKIDFYYEGENLSFIINSITFKDFNFKRDNDLRIGLGEGKYMDLDGDLKSDIYVRGIIIGVGKINLSIQNLDLIGCPENWYCSGWGSCFERNQDRSCVDLNLCQTENKKPLLVQDCVEAPLIIVNDSSSNNEPQTELNSFEDLTNYFDCGFENSTIVNDCFIQSVDECNFSKLTSKIELAYKGFLFNLSYLFKMKSDGNFCLFYQKNLGNSISCSDELVQQLIQEGYSREEILNEEKSMNESAQSFVGVWTQCRFSKNNLKAVLQNWKQGNYQGGENCEFIQGELYCQYIGDFSLAESCSSGI